MTIDPLLPVWLILVLLISLLTWSIVIEWRRSLRFKLWRIFACVIAACSLAVIFIRPANPAPSEKRTILLTDSSSHTVVDSLLRTHDGAALVHLGSTGYRNSQKLSSYRELFRAHATRATTDGSIGRIEAIVGDGLPDYALDSIPDGFHYFPSPQPDGITGISLPSNNLQRNHPAMISGMVHLSEIPATLYLSSPGGKLDSTQLLSETGPFSFSFTPRASGQITYSLTLIDSTRIRIEERVPLMVDAQTPLRIFMLQKYPTFEIQHLKNFLSDRGHQIAVRAQLSRNTYRTEFINRSATSINRITPLLLNEFDLVITDPSVLTTLSPAERSSVEDALRNGLGMIVVFDGAPTKLPGKDLLPMSFSAASADTTSIMVQGKRIGLPATRLKPVQFGGTVIAKDPSRALAGYAPIREGTVGFQLLRETYSILLAGDSVAYGSLWSPLIDATARLQHRPSAIRVVSEFPLLMNEPMAIDIISVATPELYVDSIQVPVGEDPIIDGLWHATTWPGNSGWHTLRTQTDTTACYVFTNDDWKALRLAQQHQVNSMAAERRTAPTASSTVMTPIPLTAFWIAFLLSTGFLWLAPKL